MGDVVSVIDVLVYGAVADLIDLRNERARRG